MKVTIIIKKQNINLVRVQFKKLDSHFYPNLQLHALDGNLIDI